VANQYTSILTGGLADNTVVRAYDLVFNAAYRETPMYRMWCDYAPVRVDHPGQTVRLQKYDWLSAASVTAAKTPLNEELDVDSTKLPTTTYVDLTVNEYGFAVTKTNKLVHTSMADVDGYAAVAVANHAADTIDELVQDEFTQGTQVIRAAGRASTVTVASTDYLTATVVRKAVTKLRTNKALPFGEYYAAGIHPHVIHDLREETGSGSWRVPSEYGQNQSMIWAGEFGEFEGMRFVQNTRTRKATDGVAGTAVVYRTFVLGQQAVAERAVEEPHTVLAPPVDKLHRFNTLGWYAFIGWKLYRDEALVRLESSSSMAAI
jgi:N4-gp56 family major capsid protein